METGERIRQLRTQRNMPQQALADSLGVTRQAVAKWESGASRPSAANLAALCRLVGVSWPQLAGPGGAPPRAARRARRLCAALGLLAAALAALCAAAWLWERAWALPPGVIGYADAPAKLFVAGTPAWLYVLPVLAGLAALAAAAVFLYLKYRERRGGR